MRKSIIMRFSVGIVVAMVVCGCAAFGKGPSDEELIGALLEKWKAATVAQDIDAQTALLSENFEGSEGNKADTQAFMMQVKDMGYLEDAEVLLEGADLTIEGDTATVYPIEIVTAMGTATVELKLTKEDTGWIITGMNLLY
jgi:hypothetical protein